MAEAKTQVVVKGEILRGKVVEIGNDKIY